LEREGVDILFAPSVDEMYPAGFQSTVSLSEITKPWEGASRPGHFAGVATVVTMLFNAVQPDCAIFGEKDFQQLRLIEQMVSDLKMDISIIRGALVRDSDGLALSSRNARLSPQGRVNSLALSRGLYAAKEACQGGEKNAKALEEIVARSVRQVPGAEIDYIAAVREDTLVPVSEIAGACRILVVVKIDGVRLLDNMAIA
jgi:pantoate--beta-alanine ligase